VTPKWKTAPAAAAAPVPRVGTMAATRAAAGINDRAMRTDQSTNYF
jgi:hypothetical protein